MPLPFLSRSRGEPLSGVDAAWLRMEHPTNLMMITGVLVLGTPVSREAFAEVLRDRLLRYDRFRQRIEGMHAVAPFARPCWVDDDDFDLDHHLQNASLPEEEDEQQALQQLTSRLMSTPLDYRRPLWQMHHVSGYRGGTAIVVRLHHCIGDGAALVRVLLTLTDDPEAARDVPGTAPPDMPTATAAGFMPEDEPPQLLQALTRSVTLGARGVASLGRIVGRWPDPNTVLRGSLGTAKSTRWTDAVALEDVKHIGQALGGTVNDVLMTALAGALRRYLLRHGDVPSDMDLRAAVPVDLRRPDDPHTLGNRFGLVFLSLPVGIAEPHARLPELHRRMDRLKRSPEAFVVLGILQTLGYTPEQVEDALVRFIGTKATCVATNVAGPRQRLTLSGAPLDELMFWVPQAGRLGLGLSILSYAGEVLVGVAVDDGLITDPDVLVAGFREEFEALLEAA